MERQHIELLRMLLEGRNHFFRRSYLYRDLRDTITRLYLSNESIIIDEIHRAVNHYIAPPAPLTLTIPLNPPANFFEPVIIVPTQQQIDHELQDYATPAGSQHSICSICQDAVTSGGVKLRGCQHIYHRQCISEWFHASARCPVCRRDIREGQQDHTPSASEETGSQSEAENQNP